MINNMTPLEAIIAAEGLKNFCIKHQWKVAGDNFNTNRCFSCQFFSNHPQAVGMMTCYIGAPFSWLDTSQIDEILHQIPLTEASEEIKSLEEKKDLNLEESTTKIIEEEENKNED